MKEITNQYLIENKSLNYEQIRNLPKKYSEKNLIHFDSKNNQFKINSFKKNFPKNQLIFHHQIIQNKIEDFHHDQLLDLKTSKSKNIHNNLQKRKNKGKTNFVNLKKIKNNLTFF